MKDINFWHEMKAKWEKKVEKEVVVQISMPSLGKERKLFFIIVCSSEMKRNFKLYSILCDYKIDNSVTQKFDGNFIEDIKLSENILFPTFIGTNYTISVSLHKTVRDFLFRISSILFPLNPNLPLPPIATPFLPFLQEKLV